VLVRAAEEADPEGRVLSLDERRRAGGRAPAPPAGAGREASEAFLAARARPLSDSLVARVPGLGGMLAAATVPVPGWLVLIAAIGAGVALDRLGATRRINLLAFPLIGLIAWNLAVYLWMLGRSWARGAAMRRAGHHARRASPAAVAVLRACAWAAGRWSGRHGAADTERWMAATARTFVTRWARAAGPMLAARVQRLLHLGALGFGAGAVLGMYLRGLAVEYRAGWESTFLAAAAVAALLRLVLGPAAALLHWVAPGLAPPPAELFSVESIERLRGPSVSGEAAVWIHLWAVTTALAVVAPRLVLWWRDARRARRLSRDVALPLDEPYFLRLLAPSRGGGALVDVIPYGIRPSPGRLDEVRTLLLDLFGSQARVRVAEPLGYGDPPPAIPPDEAAALACVAIVFGLAQSPEREVHGELLDEVRRAIPDSRGGQVVVLLDDAAYRARLGDAAPRLTERRRAWERLGEECGVPVVSLSGRADEDLARVRAAVAPARAGAAP
jgi:hypothetical protein